MSASVDPGTEAEQAERPNGAAREAKKSFDIFVINSGWNVPLTKALSHDLELVQSYLEGHQLYVLSREQSTKLIKAHPELIGHDPIMLVVDRELQKAGRKHFGMRVNFGLLRSPEHAMARLQHILRFIADQRAASDITRAVKRDLQRSGIDGAIEALLEAAIELH
jgi:hypothetical protein